MAFRSTPKGLVKVARAGGWGPLLGDDGSGFDLGRRAVRYVLETCDARDSGIEGQDSLVRAVLDRLRVPTGSDTVQDILSCLLMESDSSKLDARQRIADVARTVIEQQPSSATAARMITESVACVVGLLQRLIASSAMNSSDSKLVMTGGLINAIAYGSQLENAMVAAGLKFSSSEIVLQPGLVGVEYLMREARSARCS
jgi:N-acetylmuramic acid 6-phosphate etherase